MPDPFTREGKCDRCTGVHVPMKPCPNDTMVGANENTICYFKRGKFDPKCFGKGHDAACHVKTFSSADLKLFTEYRKEVEILKAKNKKPSKLRRLLPLTKQLLRRQAKQMPRWTKGSPHVFARTK